MSVIKWEVGQEAYFQSSVRYLTSQRCKVTKIGRKYVYTDAACGGAFDIMNGVRMGQGGTRGGTLYGSEAEYRDYMESRAEWDRMARRIRSHYSKPEKFTVEQGKLINSILDDAGVARGST